VFQEQRIHLAKLASTAVKNFTRRHLNAIYVPGKEEAVAKILEMIPEGATVGAADSETLVQIGIFNALQKRGNNEIVYPFFRDENGNVPGGRERTDELMRKALVTDIFLSGTNAITLDGKIVNIDGGGNRVAPMIFGPKKVIIVVGFNKITRNVDEAIRRIKEICAPINALRHVGQHHDTEFLELPCVKTGICADCYQTERICNFTAIIEGESHWRPGRINIIIIGESLGI
jgi:hypothetical protein